MLVSECAFTDLAGIEQYFHDNYSFKIEWEDIKEDSWRPDNLVARYTGEDTSEEDWSITYWFKVYELPVI